MSSNYTSDDEPYADYEDDDPNNPRHRDHDLSDSADYEYDSWTEEKPWYLQRWFMITVSLLLIVSLLLPLVLQVT